MIRINTLLKYQAALQIKVSSKSYSISGSQLNGRSLPEVWNVKLETRELLVQLYTSAVGIWGKREKKKDELNH